MTERDKVLLQRMAFRAGAEYEFFSTQRGEGGTEDVRCESLRRYPMPKTLRPRVVEYNGGQYRYNLQDGPGFIECRVGDEPWKRVTYWGAMSDGIFAVLADLVANPTEEVDDDGT